jgi:hypothetical protein
MKVTTAPGEFARLILQIERDLLAQTYLREKLQLAGRTVAGHRQELRAAKARVTRAQSIKRKGRARKVVA